MTDAQFYQILNRCMPEYNPVEKIGAGSFGSVFNCERDGIYYAIKIIPVPTNENELQMLLARSEEDEVQNYLWEKVENYRREIKLMAELKGNRNIVNIEDYKVIEAENGLGYYIVIRMELLTSLTSHAAKHMLTRDEIIRLGIDICDALSICEKHNVIHRDIKPENIMLHNDGAFKLGDFGVAKQLSKTTVGTIAGTEGFMAPEVAKGQEYNHTADIYSLGILLYYYLNNKKMPYVDPDNRSIIAEQEAIIKRMNSDAVLPTPPNTDENLSKVVLKACMFNKECRYQSAEEMRMDLTLVLQGKTVVVDLTGDSGMMVRPAPNTLTTGTVGPFSGSMYSSNSYKHGNMTQPTTTEITPPKKKKKVGLLIGGIAAAVVVLAASGYGIYYMMDIPQTTVDANGNTIQLLTRGEMEDAYELGVQYYESGNYESAISELDKVTNKSGKFDEAQEMINAARTAYKEDLLAKVDSYSASGGYETALSMLETGKMVLDADSELELYKQNVLNTLKIDHINKATAAEQHSEYAEAFSYIQTALAFLPEDAELKGLYERLDYMATAAAAVSEAESLIAVGDYEKAFTELEDALNKVNRSQTATSKITLAYEAHKKTFLDSIEKQIKRAESAAEYDQAINELEVAVKLFPDEYELQTKHTELSEMSLALHALDKVDAYDAAGEYVKLFTELQTAMEKLPMSSEAYGIISEKYDSAKTNYMNSLNEHIGEPQNVSEYENAIAELEKAVEVFPDELRGRLEEMKANRPIKLFDLNVVDAKRMDAYHTYGINENEEYLQFNQRVKDNYGNQYDDTVVMAVVRHNPGGYYQKDCYNVYITYDCRDYGVLSGTIAITEESKSYTGEMSVLVSAYKEDMSEDILYEQKLQTISRPQQINVDCSGYHLIKISLICNRTGAMDTRGSILLSDFTLSK